MLSRNFSTSARKQLLKLLGKVTLEDVRTVNGDKGETWVDSVVHTASEYPIVKGFEIQGAKAHKPHKDPSDPEEVITLGFYSANGSRVLSGHVHQDGSYKLAESRMGKRTSSKKSKK
ncbi:hypothetical protein DV735_g3062, partial [Chaetothyriales sp. CBS 134920]